MTLTVLAAQHKALRVIKQQVKMGIGAKKGSCLDNGLHIALPCLGRFGLLGPDSPQ